MKTYEVQHIQIEVPFDSAERYIADPARLPEWTSAFQSVDGGRAKMATPAGAIEIDLSVHVSAADGSIDWTMMFPDNTTAKAFSPVVPLNSNAVAYMFLLTAPPAPLEQLEGASPSKQKG